MNLGENISRRVRCKIITIPTQINLEIHNAVDDATFVFHIENLWDFMLKEITFPIIGRISRSLILKTKYYGNR